MLCVTWFDETRQTVDELADDETEDADDRAHPEHHDERHRAAASRPVPVEEVHRGQCHRGQHQRKGDGHDDEPEPAHHLQNDDGRGKDHQQSPGPCRGTSY